MTYEQWKAEVIHQLSKYGYTTELSEKELTDLHERGASPGQAFEIDCDIANGFSFEEACKENL